MRLVVVCTIQTAHTFGIEIFEYDVVLEIEIVGYGGVGEAREEHVELDAVELELDDGHERLLDHQQLGDLGLTFEQLGERGEEVGSVDMPRRNAQRVDVATLRVHAQPKRAERAHLAAHFLGHVLGHVLALDRYLPNPVLVERVDLVQHVHAVSQLRVGLEHGVLAQRLFEFDRELFVPHGREVGAQRHRHAPRSLRRATTG